MLDIGGCFTWAGGNVFTFGSPPAPRFHEEAIERFGKGHFEEAKAGPAGPARVPRGMRGAVSEVGVARKSQKYEQK